MCPCSGHKDVLRAAVHTAAVLWKRSWLDENDAGRATLWDQCRLLANGSASQQVLASTFLATLVDEVCGRQRTEASLTLELHEKVSKHFTTQGDLAVCASIAGSLLTRAISAIPAGSAPLEPALGTVIQASSDCLCDCVRRSGIASSSWTRGERGFAAMTDDDDDTESLPIPYRVPACLTPVLLDGGAMRLLCGGYEQVRSKLGSFGPLRSLRRAILALANVAACCFGSDEALSLHVATCFNTLAQWLEATLIESAVASGAVDAAAVARIDASLSVLRTESSAEVVDACSGVARLASSAGIRPWLVGGMLERLRSINERLLGLSLDRCRTLGMAVRASAVSSAESLREEREAGSEAQQLLLMSWCTLLGHASSHVGEHIAATGPVTLVEQEVAVMSATALQPFLGCVFGVFEASIRCRLGSAEELIRCGEDDDGPEDVADDSRLEEELDHLAILGRVTPHRSLPLLTSLLDSAIELHQVGKGGELERAVAAERLLWLVLFASSVLADSGDGETPTIPPALVALSREATAGLDVAASPVSVVLATCPVSRLVSQLVMVTESESLRALDASQRAVMSPLLTKVLVRSLKRLAGTYFLPCADSGGGGDKGFGQSISEALDAVFGVSPLDPARSSAITWLEKTIQTCGTVLVCWTSEAALADDAVKAISHTVSNSRRAVLTVKTPAWGAFYSGFIDAIKASVLALGGTVAAVGGEAPTSQFVQLRELPAKTFSLLASTIARSTHGIPEGSPARKAAVDFPMRLLDSWVKAAVSAGSDVDLDKSLTSLAGFVIKSAAPSEWHLFITGPHIATCGGIVAAHKSDVAVHAALSYVQSLVDWTLPDLPSGLCIHLYREITSLFDTLGRFRAASPSGSVDEDGAFDEILTILQVLNTVARKSSFDMSTVEGSPADNKAARDSMERVVLRGLGVIVPRLTSSLLSRPELAREYTATLHRVVREFGSSVAKLPPAQFASFLANLDSAIDYHDLAVAKACLDALYSLLEFHVEGTTADGGGGLHPQLVALPGAISGLPVRVLRRVLSDATASVIVSSAAHVILALSICEPLATREAFSRLLEAQSTPALRERVSLAVSPLFPLMGPLAAGSAQLPRQRLRAFTQRFGEFVRLVSSFIIVK
jgi:hypothetical protein